jgi:thiol-disulfide isomerase/thioredoxin
MQGAPTELVVGLAAIVAVVWLIVRRRMAAAATSADPPVLVGPLARSLLEAQPGFGPETTLGYVSDTRALETLRASDGDLRLLVFLGAWCPDCEREVPRFFRILEEAGLAGAPVELYGLDRNQQGAGELTARYGITRVPTFVVLRAGHELGRITERPTVALETDLAAIITAGFSEAPYGATTNAEAAKAAATNGERQA